MTTVEADREAGPESAPRGVPRMFDRIAARYDLLNRLLSARRDVAWRRRLVSRLPEAKGIRVLDVATGTGDVLAEVLAARPDVGTAVGVDPASGMLALARRKLERRFPGRARLVRAAAEALPFGDGGFDAVTIAFGIRNAADMLVALREMRRVLAPGGRALILEFSLPSCPVVRAAYLAYFRHVLPLVGGAISGDAGAYRYLNRTVEAFPEGAPFARLLEDAGFREIRAEALTLGIATLHVGGAA